MSLPLLQTSPTIQLEVPTDDYRLRANAVLSPDPSNGLKLNGDGLYAVKSSREAPWLMRSNGTGNLAPTATNVVLSSSTTANQPFSYALETYDPDGLLNLTAFPTRVTMKTAGRYWTTVNFVADVNLATGGTLMGQVMIFKNGSTFPEAVQNCIAGDRTATVVGPASVGCTCSGLIDMAAGDYLEAAFRWIFQTTPTAGTYFSTWGGGLLVAA